MSFYYGNNLQYLVCSSTIDDLEIILNSKLLFNPHTYSIENKFISTFGMIKCNCSELNDP